MSQLFSGKEIEPKHAKGMSLRYEAKLSPSIFLRTSV